LTFDVASSKTISIFYRKLIQSQRLDVMGQRAYVFLLKNGKRLVIIWRKIRHCCKTFFSYLYYHFGASQKTRKKKLSDTSYCTKLKVCMSSKKACTIVSVAITSHH